MGDFEKLARKHATVTGDHTQLCIGEDRNVEAKRFYTACELPDLFRAVQTGILRIKLKRRNWEAFN